MKSIIVPFVLFMVAIGGGFIVGSTHQKGVDLKHCKEAGWAFIEERVFPLSMVKDTIYATKQQQLQRLRHLQANLATKCTIRINK